MLSLGNKLTLNTQPIYKFVNKYSIDFDGVDDCIVTDGADTVAQPTTYSFWCKSSTTIANRGVFGHGTDKQGGFHFNWDTSRPFLYLGTNYYVFWDNTSAQDDGEWHHWVVYSDPNNLNNCKLYVDGVLQTVDEIKTTGSLEAYTESLTIGGDKQVYGNFFEGKIDEFAVYDRELTQDEITRMYNTYYSPNRVANGNFSQIGNEEVTNGDFSQIGSEEITNGDFATDSDWTAQTGWTIANGVATCDGTNLTQLYQTNVLTQNKLYKVTYSITSRTSGGVFAKLGDNILGATNSTVGTYTEYFNFTQANLSFHFRSSNFVGSIDNVSVKEVGQDWTFGTGWSVGDNKAIQDGTGNNFSLQQSNVFSLGKIYKVTFEILEITQGQIKVFAGFPNSNVPSSNTVGTHTFYLLAEGNTSLYLKPVSTFIGSVTNISVKEVGQGWTFGTGWSTDGTKVLRTAQSGSTACDQNISLNVGSTYKITYDLIISAGTFNVRFAGTTNVNGATRTTSGSYEDNIVAVTGNNQFRLVGADGAFTGSVDNIVVQELKHDATNLMLNAGAYQSANPLITSTKSMEFDGVDVRLMVNSVLGSFTGTFSFWINRDNNTGHQYIFDARGSGSGTGFAYFDTGTDNLVVSSGTRYVDGVAATSVPTDGKWHNIIITGVTLDVDESIRYGTDYGNGNAFDGKMTEVGLWDRTLTALEVASLYNQGMPTNLLVNRNNYQSGNPTVFNTKQVDFDGSDDYMIAKSTLGSFTGSVSFWVNRDSNSGNFPYVADFRELGDDSNGTGYIHFASNSDTIVASSGTIYVDNVATTTVPSDSSWHHVVVTGISLNITVNILFGVRASSAFYLNGKLSQVGLFNSTLTADEVSSLYNHGLPIDLTTNQAAYESSSNLVGYWRMGSGVNDAYPLIADQTNPNLEEKIVNGGFTTDLSGWTINNWDLSEWTSQGLHLQEAATGQYATVTQNIPLVVGKTYNYSVTLVQNGAATILLQQGSNTTILSINSSGTYTGTFVASQSGNFGLKNLVDVNDADWYISNISLTTLGGNPAIMTNQTSSDIENGSPYANIVQNGTFDTDSDWNLGSGQWVISNGFAVGTNASNNLHTNQPVAPSNGIEYTVTFTLKDVTSGYIRVGINIADSTQFNSDGTYSLNVTSSGNNYLYITPSNFNGKITNITATEVNTGLQGYWKMGDGTNDEYPVIYDQTDSTLGSELVVNGDFATDSDWTKGTGWTILGGKLVGTNVSTQFTQQSLTFTSGKLYKVSFDITGADTLLNDSAFRYPYDGAVGNIKYLPKDSPNGTYTNTFTSSGSSILYLGYIDAGTFTGTVDNVTVKELQGNPATMTNMVEGNITNQYPLTKIRNYYRMGDGILDGYPIIQDQTSPNLAHIPTTNKILYSEDFSSWTTSGVTITPDYGISPDGTQNSTRLVYSAGSKVIYKYSLHSANTETNSIYVKGVLGETIKFGKGSTVNAGDIFTLDGSWQRLEYVSTTDNQISISTYTGATARDIQIWGVQIEEQSQATAYIKSDGIAAVRKATTTNLIPYSEDFSQWTSVGGVSVTDNFTESPDGLLNASKLVFNGTASGRIEVSVTTSGTNTQSVYLKTESGTQNVSIGMSSGSLTQFTITDQWVRYTHTGSGSFPRILCNDATTIYAYGSQLEQQTQAETYAKTTGLPVTIDLFTENNYGTMTNMSASDIIEDTPNN